jgi:hypothetical protein
MLPCVTSYAGSIVDVTKNCIVILGKSFVVIRSASDVTPVRTGLGGLFSPTVTPAFFLQPAAVRLGVRVASFVCRHHYPSLSLHHVPRIVRAIVLITCLVDSIVPPIVPLF